MGNVRTGEKHLLNAYRKHIPLGRRGHPHEVAEPILFLASDMASYITGSTLLVDGGYLSNITPDFGGPVRNVEKDPDR